MPSDSSDSPEVSGASQIQQEVDLAIIRAQHLINLDQQAFEGFTYWDLAQIDLTHHHRNPQLYTLEAGLAALSSLHQFPVDISEAEEEEEVEEQGEESPLPIQVEQRDQTTQIKQGEMPSSQQPSGNLADLGTREVLWMPSHNTIPMREKWDQWIKLWLQEMFQEPLTPDHLD